VVDQFVIKVRDFPSADTFLPDDFVIANDAFTTQKTFNPLKIHRAVENII